MNRERKTETEAPSGSPITCYGYRSVPAGLGPLGESKFGGQLVASVLEHRITYVIVDGQHVETGCTLHRTGKMAVAL